MCGDTAGDWQRVQLGDADDALLLDVLPGSDGRPPQFLYVDEDRRELALPGLGVLYGRSISRNQLAADPWRYFRMG